MEYECFDSTRTYTDAMASLDHCQKFIVSDHCACIYAEASGLPGFPPRTYLVMVRNQQKHLNVDERRQLLVLSV